MPAAAHQQIFFVAVCLLLMLCQAGADPRVELTHDGPVVRGGNITFRAELRNRDGSKPSGSFIYKWKDDAHDGNEYQFQVETSNTTVYYKISCPADKYHVGEYIMEVVVCRWWPLKVFCEEITSKRVSFLITRFLNGNMTIHQTNKTISNTFVSSAETANFSVSIREGDFDFIKTAATSISTYWFIDCQYQNQTHDLKMPFNLTIPKSYHIIEALVVASFNPPPTTVAPTTTSVTPSMKHSDETTTQAISSSTFQAETSMAPPVVSSTISSANLTTLSRNSSLGPLLANTSFPPICNSPVALQKDDIYGYFYREVNVRAPISNLKTDGITWIKPWDELSLTVTCNGTGPFYKCQQIIPGKYNVTGNETCDEPSILETCDFSIKHYFLDSWEYTVLIILSNDLGTERHPVAINISKETRKPQLSVVVVPVTCSLVAVVLIVFGIAYYVQNRARFHVEVADFDFGQRSAEMEYKTFTERLRDSFNNAVRRDERLLRRHSPCYGSMIH
ncbi:hypothetical protein QAD02_018557 [Eretmocerus hayati]|uniref:Uncharacterized protein n=1 Tax=Eretmocerus hayati TaxID=131215 RepID=A0ACC2PGR1_9HYME|nr:hypothetical protein QAD02_018557 [Eretmocerus hayati]